MSSFLLVHGAWHGGWCWSKIEERLWRRGHQVLAPDLPSHGESRVPPATVTLDDYVDCLSDLLDQSRERVILVGHSMAGLVISEVAERRPEQVLALVYVTAFLLRDGQSIADVTRDDTESLARKARVVSSDRLTVTTRDEAVAAAFYGACSPEDVACAQARLKPQALAPFVSKASVTAERWGSVPRYYVECLRDRAIVPGLQHAMQAALPCRRSYPLDTDHSPFFSAPAQLTDVLLDIAERSAMERP